MAITSSQPTFPTETWSLRRQFVVPLGFLIFGIAITISLLKAWISNRVERAEIMRRLVKVYDQLAKSNYPLTPAISTQIENYSGVDIVLISSSGSLTTTSFSPAEVNAVLRHTEYIDAIVKEQSSTLLELKDAPFAQLVRVGRYAEHQQVEFEFASFDSDLLVPQGSAVAI